MSSGPNSIVGVFVGANGALQFPDGTQLVGTISAGSSGTGTVSAGANSTVGAQVGQNFPTSGLPNPPERTCDNGGAFCGGTLFNPDGSPPLRRSHRQPPQPDVPPTSRQPYPALSPQLNVAAQFTNDMFTEKKQDEVINTNQNSTPGTGGSRRTVRPAGRRQPERRQRRPAAEQCRAAAGPRPAAERHAADQ